MVSLIFTVVACSLVPSNTDRPTIEIASPSKAAGPSTVMDDALREAAAIWAVAGVDLRWSRPDPASTIVASTLTVTMDDAPGASTDEGLSLGWIRFDAAGRPEPTIHLSRANGVRLLESNPNYRSLPIKGQDVLIGRALGRALAHEIGHFLLQSSAHSSAGLMRGRLSFDDFVSTARVGLGLTPRQRQVLAERWRVPLEVSHCVNGSSL